MSFFIPKSNNYFGMLPVAIGAPTGNFQTNYYLVSSSEGTQINIGDLVILTTNDMVKSAASLTGAIVLTSSQATCGVAASILAANAGSSAAQLNQNTSQMVLVYDDPNQVFGITESSSGVIGAGIAGLFKVYPVLATGVIGSTGPLQIGNASRSNMALSGVPSSASGTVKIIGMHPVESGAWSTLTSGTASSTDCRKWLVKLVGHVNQASTSLLGIVNTTS